MADLNFTPVFNATNELVHYNQTYVMDTTGYTPLWVFLTFVIAALALLVISYRYNDEMCGGLAIIISFIVMLMSRSVDIITAYGVTGTSPNYVLMEHHTIYHPEAITIIFAICFILSILNIYRIYLLSKQEVDNGRTINSRGL